MRIVAGDCGLLTRGVKAWLKGSTSGFEATSSMGEVKLVTRSIEATVRMISIATLTPTFGVAACRSAVNRGGVVASHMWCPRHRHAMSDVGLSHHVGPGGSNGLGPAIIETGH